MIKGLKAVARERARLERNRILLSSMISDMQVGEMMLECSDRYTCESAESDEELEKLIDMLPERDLDKCEELDIEQIMASQKSMEIGDLVSIASAINK